VLGGSADVVFRLFLPCVILVSMPQEAGAAGLLSSLTDERQGLLPGPGSGGGAALVAITSGRSNRYQGVTSIIGPPKKSITAHRQPPGASLFDLTPSSLTQYLAEKNGLPSIRPAFRFSGGLGSPRGIASVMTRSQDRARVASIDAVGAILSHGFLQGSIRTGGIPQRYACTRKLRSDGVRSAE